MQPLRPRSIFRWEETSGLVDEREVKQLPLNGRSYDQLLTLNPGAVNYTAERSGSIGTSNSAVSNMFTVDGWRPQDNLFLLNGIEYTGASLINLTRAARAGSYSAWTRFASLTSWKTPMARPTASGRARRFQL